MIFYIINKHLFCSQIQYMQDRLPSQILKSRIPFKPKKIEIVRDYQQKSLSFNHEFSSINNILLAMGKAQDMIYYNPQNISFFWKFWQASLYILGSTSFLIGSMIYFPDFYNWMDADLWGDIFFIIGSTCYFFAQVRQWRHHLNFACQQMPNSADQEDIYVFNGRKRYNKYFFVYMLGNVLYLVGCVFYIPSLDTYPIGIRLFLSGFGLLVCIQIHKLGIVLLDKQTIAQQISADKAKAAMEISAAISQWMYFTGTLLFFWWDTMFLNLTLWTWGVILYVIGGIASSAYSIIYFKKLLQLQQDYRKSLITSQSATNYNQKQPLRQNLM